MMIFISLEGGVVAGQDLLDGLGTVGNDAEGHGQHGIGPAQQSLEDRLLGGQMPPFRADPVV